MALCGRVGAMQVKKSGLRQVLRWLTARLTPGTAKVLQLPASTDDWPDWLRRDLLSDSRASSLEAGPGSSASPERRRTETAEGPRSNGPMRTEEAALLKGPIS